jgi:hypothetical protein
MPFADHPLIPSGLLTAALWWVKGIVPRGASPAEALITVFYGLPGTFKTYFLVTLAICIATGRNWFGHKALQGNVLFVAGDDPGGPQSRAQAWANEINFSPKDLEVIKERARLLKMPINFFLNEDVAAAKAWLKERNFKPDVIIADTYFHTSMGAKVATSEEDNLKIITNVRDFAKVAGATAVIYSDHTPKDGRSLFGSVVKMASFDALWEATREGRALTARLVNTRMRHAPMSRDLIVEFKEVELETEPDEHGQNKFPELVLVDVREAREGEEPERKTTSEKERKDRFNAIVRAACFVIAENWKASEIISSRRTFHKMTQAAFKHQTNSEEGFSPATFGQVLNHLIDELKILRRIGQGMGARYQVVIVPKGFTHKTAVTVFPVTRSKDRVTEKQETVRYGAVSVTRETFSTESGREEKPVDPSEEKPLNFDDVLGEAVESVLAKPRADRASRR